MPENSGAFGGGMLKGFLAFMGAIGLLAAWSGYAQAPKEPTAAEKCAIELPQWRAYADNMKRLRDQLERDVAYMQTKLSELEKQVAEKK